MRCVILQPSYIPWRGYFDLVHRADVFVFYDDVQYDARGWRNRNRIKSPHGTRWLTIPVHKRGSQTEHIPISSIETVNDGWPAAHIAAITRSYAAAPHFASYASWLQRAYSDPPRNLADFTIGLTVDLAGMLGIQDTRFIRSSTLRVDGTKTDRLLAVLREVGASHYLSGPSAKGYIDPIQFAEAGIDLEWMAYEYPEYPQLYPPFDPQVSVLDLLFMAGAGAGHLIWGA